MESEAVRIAVLIDADNTSARYAEAILDELAKFGTPTIKRCYGDFSSPHLAGWKKELNYRAIRAMHQNAFTSGKNSTDSALIIDAMDLLYADNVDAFAIVTSDSDFTSLALRLRESGKVVYGVGRERTPLSLQNACDKFIHLEVLGAETDGDEPKDAAGADAAAADAAPEAPPKLNLQSALTKAVNATADDSGWTRLSAIGNHLGRTHANFDPRTFGHTKLSSLVAAQPYLETQSEGQHLLVRLKQAHRAPKNPAKQAATQKQSGTTKQTPDRKQPAKRAAAKKAAPTTA